jgi:hypothetical protein
MAVTPTAGEPGTSAATNSGKCAIVDYESALPGSDIDNRNAGHIRSGIRRYLLKQPRELSRSFSAALWLRLRCAHHQINAAGGVEFRARFALCTAGEAAWWHRVTAVVSGI